MYTVDLNSDLGESFGNYKIGNDDKVIPLISSANVACGYHASDPVVMGNTLAMAKEAGIRIGAHPGFPDLMGFGRRNLSVSPAEAKAYVLYQLGALDAFCRVTGVKMQHVKPHGALYNMAAEDYALSTAICEAIKEFDSSLIVLALSGGQLAKAAQDMGLRTAMEVFADRAWIRPSPLCCCRPHSSFRLHCIVPFLFLLRLVVPYLISTALLLCSSQIFILLYSDAIIV